jgi:GTP-binding protein HflX
MPRAIIVCPDIKSHSAQHHVVTYHRLPEARAEEAINLCDAIDLEIVQVLHFNVNKVRPATLIGSGQMQEVASLAKEEGVEVVVIDAEITPMQQRNLEIGTSCKVIDRPALILEIFGKRAKSREGRLQVELAALDYQKSRLVRSWTHLERQRGGFGFLGGPGESQIETDRRLIRERMAVIQKQLDKVVQTRGLHRRVRDDVPYPTVALIGYTNAGKSTLFNRLTHAEVLAKDALFATLDPTTRRVRLPSGMEILLSDTVGFIANLPTQLIAAFRATLEEVRHADLLLHVRDITHPDTHAQKEDVMHVMYEIFGEEADAMPPIIELWNKCDKADSILAENLALYTQNPVAVSALTGFGVEATMQAIQLHLADALYEPIEYHLPMSAGEALAWLYRHGIVERCDTEGDVLHIWARLSASNIRRFTMTFQHHPTCAQSELI